MSTYTDLVDCPQCRNPAVRQADTRPKEDSVQCESCGYFSKTNYGGVEPATEEAPGHGVLTTWSGKGGFSHGLPGDFDFAASMVNLERQAIVGMIDGYLLTRWDEQTKTLKVVAEWPICKGR